ncbi:MAG: glycerate kinase family protein [Nocardioidaceae bacterium]
MRVLIAPDKFAGTLTAGQAATAIATGWGRHAPGDRLTTIPMADGGPGFVDALHGALGGDLLAVTVTGPFGAPSPATILRIGDTAYLESAQACGLHLDDRRDPEHASTTGVGQLIAAALDSGATTLVVGLGGSATNDAGAGLLSALGATADGPLDQGAAGLAKVTRCDLRAAQRRLAGVDLVAATDVDSPLLGMFGATNVFGPQKGLADERKPAVDAILDGFVVATLGSEPSRRQPADAKGAGAAGGLGFGLFVLGGHREPGVDLVARTLGLPDAARRADLALTGEGAYDFSSRAGKVVYGVAQAAATAIRPCVVLAGRVLIGGREMRTMGVESAYSMVDLVGEEAAMSDAAGSLEMLAERVARTWSH